MKKLGILGVAVIALLLTVWVTRLWPGRQGAVSRENAQVLQAGADDGAGPASDLARGTASGDTAQVGSTPGAAGVITGRIYDAETGQGISGASAYASSDWFRSRNDSTRTDADGVYRIEGLGPGEYVVDTSIIPGYPRLRPEERKTVVLRGGETVARVDFAFSAGLAIAGRVVDENNNPVSGAHVAAEPVEQDRGSYQRETATSGNDGEFKVFGFRPGQKFYVQASKDNGVSQLFGPQQQSKEGTDGVILTITAADGKIQGTIVDGSGRPVPGVGIAAVTGQRDLVGADTGVSDSAGRFSIEGLPAGDYELRFVPPGSGPGNFEGRGPRVKVRPHETVGEVQVIMGG